MQTQVITVKVDTRTKAKLEKTAKYQKRSQSEVIRDALDNYLKAEKNLPNAGTMLLEMAKDAQKYEYTGPSDLFENLDKYLYEKI